MPAKKPYLLISWPQPSFYNPPKRSFINLCYIPRFNHPSRTAPSRCLLSKEACRHPGLISLI
ncbi:uncharacterized protein BKA55DRAFT_689997 [Fusarium redolens]|uniref:Uncharacterized protein n=1 Tax=Fusarium redolens TaxID=48865 RepID=A0A9P9H236_FUSRE|nr:uncharacterized protein BKA55DRAFT_689997 [Fusarium redolens]KAH7249760.1 hypothetical protein BKA55DRAFT_689997 [Fusarium redolens]